MAERVIEVRGLHKRYGDVEAVGGIDFDVDAGEVFAMLGPNGAGKTTTTEILEGFRDKTAGEVSVLGHDPAKGERSLKERIGIVLQSTGVDPFLTVRETIEMYGGYYPRRRPTDEVIDVVGLAEKRDARVRTLSGGQQRRLDVAIGLAGDPDLLFLDEPTTGFDPTARRNAWEMVKGLVTLGKTVFLTTHFMDEAQYLADRVVVITHGEIVAQGAPDTLAGRNVMRAKIRFRLRPGSPEPPATLGLHSAEDGVVEIRGGGPDGAAASPHRMGPRAARRPGRARGGPPDPRGRVPRADRRRGGARVRLLLRQVGYTNKTFWRNPASAFFTFAFPLLFLVIFTTLLGNTDVPFGTGTIKSSTYYVASMAAFGLIGACYTNIAISLVFTREAGILKRTRGTPLPGWAYLGARVVHAALVGFLLIAITVAFGVLAYHATLPRGSTCSGSW